MKSTQRYVLSPEFLSQLERIPLISGSEGLNRSWNRMNFMKSILESDIGLKFNCPNEKFQDIRKESEILDWIMQRVAETGVQRVFINKENVNEMAFLEFGLPPTGNQQNNIYLKSFTAKEINNANNMGVMALTPEDIVSDMALYVNNGGIMQKGANSTWEFTSFRKTCNSMIVADRYIFTKEKEMNLFPLLDTFLPKKYVGQFSISIFTMLDETSNLSEQEYFKKQWLDINRWLKANRKFEIDLILYSCRKKDFHDRHILTNYHLISCPAGFDIVGKRDITKPSGCYDGTVYKTSRSPINVTSDAHSTVFNVFFPIFSLANNRVEMANYISTIDDLKKVIEAKRLKVDKSYVTGHKSTASSENRLFLTVK